MRNYSVEILDNQGEYFISFCEPVLARAAQYDEKAAWQYLDEAYRHGGGWSPFKGFQVFDPGKYSIKYPGDPAMKPHALIRFGEETVAFYDSAWVAIWQTDGTFEICRMD